MSAIATVELASFQLAPGVTEAELLEASATLERGFLAHQPGYLGRLLVKKTETEWTDYVFWNSDSEAKAASERAMQSAACSSYFQLMSPEWMADPNHGLQHFAVKGAYGAIVGSKSRAA